MTCRKTFAIDLEAFGADPEAPEWSAFRAHHPTCPDCSAELAIWDEMRVFLTSGEPEARGAHPPKELLLRYEEAPETLRNGERSEIEGHLRACRSCPDELTALRRFDFSAVQRRPLPVAAPGRTSLLDLLDAIRAAVWRPAFAYAVAAVVLAAVVMHPRFGSRRPVTERIARSVDGTTGSATRPREPAAEPVEPPADTTADGLADREPRGPLDATVPRARTDRLTSDAPPAPSAAEDRHAEEEPRLAAATKRSRTVPPRGDTEKRARVTMPSSAGSHDAPESQTARHEDDAPVERPRNRAENDADLLADDEGSDDDGDAPRVLGLSGSEAPVRDRWYRLALTRDRPSEVKRSDVAAGVVLTLSPVPQPVIVRVAGPGVDPAIAPLRIAANRPVEVRLPAEKLVAGTYRVTIDPTTADGSSTDYTFVVR